jgi:geranylgeranyl diphosphate synthase type I
MQLDVFRDWFDARFERFVEERTQRYRQFTNRDVILGAIDQVRMLARGGKRVRPFLTYLSYKAEGGENPEEIERVLFAIELFHVFCLIHDDIIDEDDLRRGVTTVNAFARAQCMTLGRPQLAEHVGNAQALLVGDLVFAWVFELLAPHLNDSVFAEEFMYTVDEVVIGQMIDVDLTARTSTSREVILEKMRLKTAGYTFVQPLRIGRVLAGKKGRDVAVDALGLAIGLGFQMQDDLLDVYGTEETLGKSIASDIEESQHTLLTQHVIDTGKADDIRELHVLVGQAVDDDRLHLLRGLFDRTGASAALRKDIEGQMGRARELAASLHWGAEEKEALSRFIAYVAARIA